MSFKNEDLRRIYNAILGIPPTFYTGFANYDLKQIYDAIIAGSGGGMGIGLPISGADPNRVLFSDAAGVLNQDPLFNFDNLSKRMYLGEAVGNTARLNLKGFGTTAATSSFISKNSANTIALNIKDDLTSTFGGTIIGTNFRGTGNSGGSFESNSISSSTDAFYSLLLGSLRLYTNVGGYLKATSSIIVDANGAGSLNSSAISQIDSTTKGFLMPRMTQAQILAIATPANGLMAYNTDINTPCFYNGAAWQKISHANM
jgi:hypothetical protein